MSKDLTIALQNAIGDLGTDVLKSPFLVNIPESYDVFDVQDRYSEIKKEVVGDERKGAVRRYTVLEDYDEGSDLS